MRSLCLFYKTQNCKWSYPGLERSQRWPYDPVKRHRHDLFNTEFGYFNGCRRISVVPPPKKETKF